MEGSVTSPQPQPRAEMPPLEPEETLEAPLPPPTPDPEVLAEVRQERRRRWRWIVGGGLLLALIGGGIALAVGGADKDPFQMAPVERGDLESHVVAVGQVEPLESVEVGSELSGTVKEVLVEVNDRVETGQVLARLDTLDVQSALTQAEAQVGIAQAALDQARVQAEQARVEQERTRRLIAVGAATTTELETSTVNAEAARAQVASANAQLRQARASLERARQDLEQAEIRSPIAGVVIQRLVDPGQTVVSAFQATPLFEIASDLGEMKAEVSIDEADVGKVKAGQPARFTVSAWPERVFEATVESVDIAPDPTDTVVSYLAELRIQNPDNALRPGMTATAEILVDKVEDVLKIPTQALRYNPPDVEVPQEAHVWTLEGEEPVLVRVEVIGAEGAETAVRSPEIEAGEPLIIAGGGGTAGSSGGSGGARGGPGGGRPHP